MKTLILQDGDDTCLYGLLDYTLNKLIAERDATINSEIDFFGEPKSESYAGMIATCIGAMVMLTEPSVKADTALALAHRQQNNQAEKSIQKNAVKHTPEKANSRLIASAPELLECAQRVLRNALDHKNLKLEKLCIKSDLDLLTEAIAKATGKLTTGNEK